MVELRKWFVYIAKCKDGSLYTGFTSDVTRRIAVHNSGKGSKYTRSRRPVKLVWSQKLRFKNAALRREAEIKSWVRAKKQALIRGK